MTVRFPYLAQDLAQDTSMVSGRFAPDFQNTFINRNHGKVTHDSPNESYICRLPNEEDHREDSSLMHRENDDELIGNDRLSCSGSQLVFVIPAYSANRSEFFVIEYCARDEYFFSDQSFPPSCNERLCLN